MLKNWVPLDDRSRSGQKLFVPLYEVIRGNVHKLYGGMTITAMTVLRITRDAEVEIEDDSVSEIRALVQEQVRQRRYEPIVRLEFGPGADPAIKEAMRERFQLSPCDVYDMEEEVDYTALFEIAALPIAELIAPGGAFSIPRSGWTGPRSSPRFVATFWWITLR